VHSATAAEPGPNPSPERVPPARTELLLILAFWTFMAVLASANAVLDPRGRAMQSAIPTGPVAVAFVQSYLWAALTPLIFRLATRFRLERSNRVAHVLVFLVAGLLVAMFVEQAIAFIRLAFFDPPRRFRHLGPFAGITRLWFLDDLIVYIAVLAAGVARDYFLRFRAHHDEMVSLQTQSARLEAQLAEARLAALRTQLDPHFLFNTLHAVSALVERDPRGVRRMISRLSDLLRHTLEGGREQEVPLAQEWQFVERYLEIMQIRFQGRLKLDLRMQEGIGDALVPSLVLQPLVENAIKHGVSKTDGSGEIVIAASREGGRLLLRVHDDGPAFPAGEPAPPEGVGLRNTRERLEQLYGAHQTLTLAPGAAGGAVAEVSLPYHTRSDLRAAGVNFEG
jgi:two-component sensor histidine kinase